MIFGNSCLIVVKQWLLMLMVTCSHGSPGTETDFDGIISESFAQCSPLSSVIGCCETNARRVDASALNILDVPTAQEDPCSE